MSVQQERLTEAQRVYVPGAGMGTCWPCSARGLSSVVQRTSDITNTWPASLVLRYRRLASAKACCTCSPNCGQTWLPTSWPMYVQDWIWIVGRKLGRQLCIGTKLQRRPASSLTAGQRVGAGLMRHDGRRAVPAHGGAGQLGDFLFGVHAHRHVLRVELHYRKIPLVIIE